MSKSIRYYYFTSIAAVLVASVLVLGLIQVYTSVRYIREQKQNQLTQLVVEVKDGVAQDLIHLEEEQSLRYIGHMARIAESQVLVTDSEGEILYVTESIQEKLPEMVPAAVVEFIHEASLYMEVGTLHGVFLRNQHIAAAPLTDADGELDGVVIAYSDASNLNVYVTDMVSSFILSSGLVLLVASMLAFVLTNRTVIPIRRVSNAARRFGEGDYSARVPVEGDDELAQLALTFNEMAASCEATDISRRSFMGNIAHELRTPMTSIKGFIDGMLDGTIGPEMQPKYLKIVSEEVGRLARLTQNMLDISKLEAGESTPNLTSFDVWEPLASVALSAEQRLSEKNIEVRGLEDLKPVYVTADEDYTHQVIFNLFDNAIKFVDEGGVITVDVSQNKGFATISIHNTGAGIPADTLSQIFERFYKADKSRGLNAAGSGLGLHICKVLTGLMGGRIWAESQEGEGTSFKFTLPSAPARRGNVRWAEGRIKEEEPD